LWGLALRGRSGDLGDGSAQQASQHWAIQVVVVTDSYVTDQFPRAFEDSVGIGELCTAIEAEVDVVRIGHHVAEAIFNRLTRK
jgi:hypothetical protein